MSTVLFSTTVEKRVYVTADVDIHADDLDDDELLACVDEARRRGLIGPTTGTSATKECLEEVLHDLMAGRWYGALDRFEVAMFGDGTRLMDAYRAMKAENYNAALVALDYALFPSDAAATASQSTGAK